MVIAAPLFEEVLFRGFLFAGIACTRVGNVGAVLVTTAIWLVPHAQYDLRELGLLDVSGLPFGLVRWRTGSVVAAVVAHALQNGALFVDILVKLTAWCGPSSTTG